MQRRTPNNRILNLELSTQASPLTQAGYQHYYIRSWIFTYKELFPKTETAIKDKWTALDTHTQSIPALVCYPVVHQQWQARRSWRLPQGQGTFGIPLAHFDILIIYSEWPFPDPVLRASVPRPRLLRSLWIYIHTVIIQTAVPEA
jgi:hypothetical protein